MLTAHGLKMTFEGQLHVASGHLNVHGGRLTNQADNNVPANFNHESMIFGSDERSNEGVPQSHYFT
jgi:hypothetical protein